LVDLLELSFIARCLFCKNAHLYVHTHVLHLIIMLQGVFGYLAAWRKTACFLPFAAAALLYMILHLCHHMVLYAHADSAPCGGAACHEQVATYHR
jgi:hypothetical protein